MASPIALPLSRRALATSTATAHEAQPRHARIGAAGQDDRHPRAQHDAGRIGAGQEGQALGEHVAGFQVGTISTLARPATGESIFLIFAASGSMALSSASGPSTRAPVIWWRSTILHSAAASIVDGTFGLTVSIADRTATRTSG
jgi:hypothetical protein